MAKITNVYGREVLDSRGNPTVEVEITLETERSPRHSYRPARPPATSRPSSCATATRPATAARAPSRPSAT